METLSSMPLLKDIDKSVLKTLHNQLKRLQRKYQKGKVIKLQGDVVFGLFFLLEGEIVIEIPSFQGKTLQVNRMKSPNVLSPVFLTARTDLPVLIRCTTDSVISLFPKNQFYKLLQKDELLLDNFLSVIASRISFLVNKIEFLNFNTIRKKLIFYLLELPIKDGWILLPSSITELAEFFGVERPSLSNIISELVQEGLISKKGHRKIQIIDLNRLKNEL